MHSWEIAKWQSNVAEDIAKGKLGEENLINAILEVARTTAEFKEEVLESIYKINAFERDCTLSRKLLKYECRLFGLHVFTVMEKEQSYSDLSQIKSGYRGAVRAQFKKLKSLFRGV